MKNILDFNNYKRKKRIIEGFVINELHKGVKMMNYSSLNESSDPKERRKRFENKPNYELDLLLKKSKENGEEPIIKEFVPEIKSLVKKFFNSGQSGGSAPFVSKIITDVIYKLLKQEPLTGIMNTDDEWEDVSDISDMNPGNFYQNKRLSSVFKEGKNKKPYYIDAIVFKDQNGITFTGNSIKTKNGDKISSSQYIKKFPFEPKTFYIDVIEKDRKTTIIKDEKQLKKVWNFYDKKD